MNLIKSFLILSCCFVKIFASLGVLEINSYLGQKLDAIILLNNNLIKNYNQIQINLAPREEFDKLAIPFAPELADLNFKLIKSNTDFKLKISSTHILLQPVLKFILNYQLNNNDYYQEYTLLLDPPAAAQQSDQIKLIPEKTKQLSQIVHPKINISQSLIKVTKQELFKIKKISIESSLVIKQKRYNKISQQINNQFSPILKIKAKSIFSNYYLLIILSAILILISYVIKKVYFKKIINKQGKSLQKCDDDYQNLSDSQLSVINHYVINQDKNLKLKEVEELISSLTQILIFDQSRNDIRLKLLELYATNNQLIEFKELLNQLLADINFIPDLNLINSLALSDDFKIIVDVALNHFKSLNHQTVLIAQTQVNQSSSILGERVLEFERYN